MPLQAWQSNPDLLSSEPEEVVARPRHLNVIYPSSIYRSTSLGGDLNSPCEFSTALNSPEHYEHFYTPRATIKNRVSEKLKIPEIVLLNSTSSEFSASRVTPKRFTVNRKMRNPRSVRRFDTSPSSPFKHREVKDLLKSAKRRLKRITDDQGSSLSLIVLCHVH